MFENAELGQSIDRETYDRLVPEIRERLLDAQYRLKSANFSVVIVIGGVEGGGKGETVNLLMEWLDPRDIAVHALSPADRDESQRPGLHRFWQQLPPKGKLTIFFGSWYSRPVVDFVLGSQDAASFERELTRIVEFERMLADEGVLLLKFWLHISKAEQRRRMEKLSAKRSTAWRVTKSDWKFHKQYDRFRPVCSRALERTSTGHAPWEVIEATDRRFCHVTVGDKVAAAIENKLATEQRFATASSSSEPAAPNAERTVEPPTNMLRALDLSQKLEPDEYEKLLERHQARLGRLARKSINSRRAVVAVFEGPDAAGKGGCIRRIVHALDARYYRVIPIAAPTDEERAHPYLWRFWRHLPEGGHSTIYDRSWYGRVLVERVEGLCPIDVWRRAYAEIASFEQQLSDSGIIVLKFWLHISPEEQLRRFKEREQIGYKRYKITEEDYRNREKWPDYEAAACEMFARTSLHDAPWTLVEAEDKRFARIKVLRTIIQRLKSASD